MSAAMTLASCGGTKDAGQQQDAAALIQRSDIKIEGKRMTPEALWAMGRIGSGFLFFLVTIQKRNMKWKNRISTAS